MRNNIAKKELVTIRVKGAERVQTLDSVRDFISDNYGMNVDYTGAVNWLLKQFEDDKIAQ